MEYSLKSALFKAESHVLEFHVRHPFYIQNKDFQKSA